MKGNVNYLELANSPLMWGGCRNSSRNRSFSVRTVFQEVTQSSKRDWN